MMKHKAMYLSLATLVLLGIGFFLWKLKPHPIRLRVVSFSLLPGWAKTDTKLSFYTFQRSCRTFLKQDPDKSVGSEAVELQVKDWQPACKAALLVDGDSNKKTKAFFEAWFKPVEFYDIKSIKGLFTGYYMPLLKGSLTKTETYNVPIYGLPKDIVLVNLGLFDKSLKNRRIVGRVNGNRLMPYYTREEINQGAIAKVAPVLAWIDSPVDLSFLEIQGSGHIVFSDGNKLAINYVAENGAPYVSIAKVLIDMGVMTRDNASMQNIRTYLEAHPKVLHVILNQNKSFVFFERLPHAAALGAQGVVLTPGYSLAIDRKWVPLGAPIWLNTARPSEKSEAQRPFQRLMIAQDTGGAIRGAVRGDVYWGAGVRATSIAGRMKNPGHYWLLLPQHTVRRVLSRLH